MGRPQTPALFVIGAFALGACGVGGCARRPVGEPLHGWERTEGGAGIDAPERVPDALSWESLDDPSPLVFPAGSGSLWLRARARCDPTWRDPVVFVPKAYVRVAAYVDGDRVGEPVSYREASGTPWYVVPIRCGGTDVVEFHLTSRYTQIGFPEPPRSGDRAELVSDLVPRDAPRIVVAILFLLIGIVSGILAVGRRERRPLLGLLLYGLGLGAWTLFHTRTKQLWLPAGDVWFAIWWIAVPLISTGVALFLDGAFGPGPRRVIRLLWVSLAVVTGAAALSLVLVGDAFSIAAAPVFVAGRGLSVLGTVVVVVHLVRLAKRGDRTAPLFLGGLAIAFVTALHDFALSFHWIGGDDTWTQWGYAAFGLSLVLIVRRRIALMQRDLADHAAALDRYVRERDALMRDLHDGLGGIVTNVRMLAERGQGNDDAGVLGSISRLASEGVTELRTLIFGFEGLPETWRQVAAELRRSGATALDAHDIEHRFDFVASPDAPRPELETVLNLMRVHREAITNALKYAHAGRVDVALRVDAGALELAVEDDGRGPAAAKGDAAGVSLQKGLKSMRTRAARLGAELEIGGGSGGGTRVSLRVPF